MPRPWKPLNKFCRWSSLAMLLAMSLSLQAADPPAAQRWEPQIRAFEARDEQTPPPRNGIVFIGSSSIRLWDLQKSFPDLPAVNRGFGGSQIADSTYYAERILLPYHPRVVVLYAGDNDIAAGKSPEQVAADYGEFVATVHAELPEARIVFIAIKPSIKRWSLVEKMREANRMIRERTEKDERLSYVDIDRPMLDDHGQPRSALFADDGLHLNEQGYELWTSLVRPHLRHDAPRAADATK